MNWDSWEEPKNSLMAATIGRMFTSDCGVISSGSCMLMRSRTTRSIRDRPMRNWFWISSPTQRRRRLPKWSMSSTLTPSAPACRPMMYCMVLVMSSSVSVEQVDSS